ncbi:MAG: hypothetical protein LCH92_22230 [Proteobacteria bacterium]|nr:hypothetical protein [Pseudomonadota bacterium]
MKHLVFLMGLCWAGVVQAQEAGVSLTGDLVAGGQVSVTWTGPNGQNDWVGFAEPGAAGSSWVSGAWAYTNMGNPLTLTLPMTAGSYELRYVTGGSEVLAAQAVTLAAPAGLGATGPGGAALQPVGALMGGAVLSVGWSGPNGQGDWIGLAPVSGAASSWLGSAYAYTSAANPVQIGLPLEGGSYELRYVTGGGQILVSIPLSVVPGGLPSVALPAMTAPEGALLSVALGPDAPRAEGDYLYIARPGGAPGDYSGGYVTIPAQGPAQINAPATAGEWELRYVVTRGTDYIPVGSAPLTVTGPDYKSPRNRP